MPCSLTILGSLEMQCNFNFIGSLVMPCSFMLNLTVCGMLVLHVHICFLAITIITGLAM